MADFKIIIGANYGDEGKGLASRYFTLNSKGECLTVLFNGSCQRGHTVDLPNGNRHVFHHFGCGTFDGADTYFDKNFMINPLVFMEEYQEISIEKIYCHPQCRVVTPYDIILNCVVEESRGEKHKHGSCGLGVWETSVRYNCSDFNLCLDKMLLFNDTGLIDYLSKLKHNFFFKRLEEYGIDYNDINQEYRELIEDDNILVVWVNIFRAMSKKVTLAKLTGSKIIDYPLGWEIKKYDTIIYEGAQGLGLDEKNYRRFPHVSASSTTSEVPLDRIKLYKKPEDTIEIIYITRSYFTRHGAGYLEGECEKNEINPLIVDKTNVPNPFQDSIRYGKFDLETFKERVYRDISKTPLYTSLDVTYSLFVTHLNYAPLKELDELQEFFDKCYESADPFAENVKEKL